MIAHTFNNVRILKEDKGPRVLKSVKRGEYINMGVIAQRIGASRAQARVHVRRLVDCGKLEKAYRNGRVVYVRGHGYVKPRRDSSIEFAGPRSFGRGLANW